MALYFKDITAVEKERIKGARGTACMGNMIQIDNIEEVDEGLSDRKI